MRSFLPNSVLLQSTFETSRNTRGRKPIASSARRLRARVVSVSGAADQIVPIVAIEVGARLRDELVQVLESGPQATLGIGCSPSLVYLRRPSPG